MTEANDDTLPEDDEDDVGGDVLEFTPEEDAEIEGIAETVADMMDEYEMDCEVHFPDFTMEVPQGTPVEEIIAAYEDFCAQIAEAKAEMEKDKK